MVEKVYVAESISECHLGVVNVTTRLACANRCLQTQQCTLFCLKSDGCHLSNARVALHYTPQGTSTQCYSSWISNRDAASNASITSIGDYNAKLLETHATIGFYCYGERLCFSSIRTYRPWWAAKLGTRRRVTSVRIQIRRAAISYFEDVEIRVGDDENNINNNQLLGFYSGTASNGEVVTFTANPYVLGSIVYIQSLDNDYYMQLCDVQILYI
ncbi:uncharacterized protein LOC121864267 [Homarus americanus]|uniref:uncharacterized protein LOC121864267 n=1 Tax=Homarus americanus TaxID=6706 RepID=UPI001C47DA91|nr:uncharacterized protein LOC121864267 [Homarus americanus]